MIDDSSVKQTVLLYFRSRNGLPGSTEAEQLKCEYLDQGVIDSMGFVEMVMHFERDFGISFSAEDMQSMEFRTIEGLIQVIERLRRQWTDV